MTNAVVKSPQIERELESFVNPPEVEAFTAAVGPDALGKVTEDSPELPYYAYVTQFRQCWSASDPAHRDTANLVLDKILSEDPCSPTRLEALKKLGKKPCPPNRTRPVFCVDLTGAGIRAWSRDYFDELAFALIRARRRLGVCLAENCPHPYFIARYPRQHYCSDECLAVGRRASKRSWAQMNYQPKSSKPNEFGVRSSGRKREK